MTLSVTNSSSVDSTLLQQWKSSPDYLDVIALIATYYWGEKLYDCFQYSASKAKLGGHSAPIIPSLTRMDDGSHQIQAIDLTTNKLTALTIESKTPGELDRFIAFREANEAQIGKQSEYVAQNIEVGFKAIFSTLKSEAAKNEKQSLSAERLKEATKLQTYLNLRSKTMTKIVSKGVAVSWAVDAMASGAETGQTMKSLGSVMSASGTAIDLVFSVFNLGFDAYRFTQTEDAYQRSTIATQIGFDTVSSILSLASLGAAAVAAIAESATVSALATLASATLGPIGVVFSGIGIGTVGLVAAFNDNQNKLEKTAKQLSLIYDAYKSGGYKYVQDKALLQPINGAVFKSIDLRNKQVEFGNQYIFQEEHWRGDGGGSSYFDGFGDENISRTKKISLRKALGWDKDSAPLIIPAGTENLLLPFSPVSNATPCYNSINLSAYNKYTPEISRAGEVEKHQILFRYRINRRKKGMVDLIWSFFETEIDIYLNKDIRNIYVPELPREPYYTDHYKHQHLTGGFTYKLHGEDQTSYVVYLRDKATIELNSDGANTHWILYYSSGKLSDEAFKWNANTLQIGDENGPKVRYGSQNITNTVVIDQDGDQRPVDFAKATLGKVDRVDGNLFKGNMAEMKSHLISLYEAEGRPKGYITIDNFKVNNQSVGRAWFDGHQKKLLYATTPNPDSHTLKEDAQILIADDKFFFCSDPHNQLIWKVDNNTHQVVGQYPLRYRNSKSSIKSIALNDGAISIVQEHQLKDGDKVELAYQALGDQVILTGILATGVNDLFPFYTENGKLALYNFEERLSEILNKGASSLDSAVFKGVSAYPTQLGPVVTLTTSEEGGKYVSKLWIAVKEQKLVSLLLKDAKKGKDKNRYGVPNDLLMAGTVKNTSNELVYYFFSLQFKTLYTKVEGQAYGTPVQIDNLANVTVDENGIYIIQENGNIHTITREGSLKLLGVGKKWMASQSAWWKGLDTFDASHANLNRIVLLLGVAKGSGDAKKRIPGWYHRDFKTVVFSPLTDDNPNLRFQGYAADGKGAWFFDEDAKRAYYQPVTAESVLLEAFKRNSAALAAPEKIPAPTEILKELTVIKTHNVDGKLVVSTEEGAIFSCISPWQLKLVQANFSSAQISNAQAVIGKLNQWSSKYANEGVIEIYKEARPYAWYYEPARKIVAGNPGDEKASFIGYDIIQQLGYVYAPDDQTLYAYTGASSPGKAVFKAREMRKLDKSLFIAVAPSNTLQILPVLRGIDYVYIYGGLGTQNYEVSTSALKMYKVIAIDEWSEDKGLDQLHFAPDTEASQFELGRNGRNITLSTQLAHSGVLVFLNALDRFSNKAFKNATLSIGARTAQSLNISMERLVQALKYGRGQLQLGSDGIAEKDGNLLFEPAHITLKDNSGEQQRAYKVKEFGDILWMVENFNNQSKGKHAPGDPEGLKFGGYYTHTEAEELAPDGWQVPNFNDWRNLIGINGGVPDEMGLNYGSTAYEALIKGGTSGFDALMGGFFSPDYTTMFSAYRTEEEGHVCGFYGGSKANQSVNLEPTDGHFNVRYIYRNFGYFEDKRNNKLYQTLSIDTPDGVRRTFMLENLNYYSAALKGKSWAYDDKESNTSEGNGRLYSLEGANTAAPKGWRLPNDSEWQVLAEHFGATLPELQKGGSRIAFTEMLSGVNTGFNAKLAGYRQADGQYMGMDKAEYYWSRTPKSPNELYTYGLVNNTLQRKVQSGSMGLSARYVYPTLDFYTDPRDHQVYPTVEFEMPDGSRKVWMVKNMAFAIEGKSWIYNDGKTNGKADPSILKNNGRLYTWEAAVNEVPPPGWHLSTNEEWLKLIEAVTGAPYKHNGVDISGFLAGDNRFDAVFGGVLLVAGGYQNIGLNGGYWAGGEAPQYYNFFKGKVHQLFQNTEIRNNEGVPMAPLNIKALACRCVKDE